MEMLIAYNTHMALTQDDKKFIEDAITRAFIDFWDQVLEKRFESMVTKDELKEEMNSLETRLSRKIMEESQSTRDHATKVVSDSSGESIKRDRTLNKKTDTVAEKLGAKDIFTESDVTDIKNISPFPVQPTVE